MSWGPWSRKNRRTADRGPVDQSNWPSDDQVLAIVADQLTGMYGHTWHVADGQVTGPGRTAVSLGAPHPGEEGGRGDGHLDLTFILDTNEPSGTAIVDCVIGLGATPQEKVHRAVEVWTTTTATTFLELLEQRGEYATYLGPHAANGVAGWDTLHGRVIGWGSKDHHDTVQNWATDHALLAALGPALTQEPFERKDLIGVKIFFGSHGDHEAAEVRVNGHIHPAASEVLQALAWPRVQDGASYARTFVLLVQRSTT